VTATGTEVVRTVEYLLVMTLVELAGQLVTVDAHETMVISVVFSTVTVESFKVVVAVEAL